MKTERESEGEYKAADIMRADILDILDILDRKEMLRRLTSLCMTANKELTPGTLRMLAEMNRMPEVEGR